MPTALSWTVEYGCSTEDLCGDLSLCLSGSVVACRSVHSLGVIVFAVGTLSFFDGAKCFVLLVLPLRACVGAFGKCLAFSTKTHCPARQGLAKPPPLGILALLLHACFSRQVVGNAAKHLLFVTFFEVAEQLSCFFCVLQKPNFASKFQFVCLLGLCFWF